MAKKWTEQEVRCWILNHLLTQYMKNPVARVAYSLGTNATDEAPSGDDIYREAEWLQYHGYIEAEFEPGGVRNARITPQGRDEFRKLCGKKGKMGVTAISLAGEDREGEPHGTVKTSD